MSLKPIISLIAAGIWMAATLACGEDELPPLTDPRATEFPTSGDVVLGLISQPLHLRAAPPIFVGNRSDSVKIIQVIMTSPEGHENSAVVSVQPKTWGGTGFRVDLPGLYQVVLKDGVSQDILASGSFVVDSATGSPGE